MSYKEIANKYLIQVVVIIVFIVIASIVSTHYELLLFMLVAGGIFFVYKHRNKSLDNREKTGRIMQCEFIYFYQLMMTFLSDKNDLVLAIKKSNEYLKGLMQKSIFDLLMNIDADKTATPYIAFADNFASYAIKELMVNTYQNSKRKEKKEKIIVDDEIETMALLEISKSEEKKRLLGDIIPITCFVLIFIMFFANLASTMVVNVNVA